MKKTGRLKFKKGAASFYVVAFSTLVLVIIAASFAAVVLTELARTQNDDLSQSAYDTALAGIEDAKLAFYNYQSCVEQGAVAAEPNGSSPLTCGEIVWYVTNSHNQVSYAQECDMVAHVLGRIGERQSGEDLPEGGVLIKETTKGDNLMQQVYTCVKMDAKLIDYRSTLTEENPTRVIKVKLASTSAANIERVRISWYSRTDGTDLAFNNFDTSVPRVKFPTLRDGRAATPPTLSVGMVQTTSSFSLSDFEKVTSTATDRALLYFVPTDNKNSAKKSNKPDNYIGAYDGSENIISATQVIKSNDRSVKNLPYAVYCSRNLDYNGFACSVTMEMPDPIGGLRSDDTFMFIVGIPYGQPSTDFAIEYLCAAGTTCGSIVENGEEVVTEQAVIDNRTQLSIDSTGRASTLYRRVEARMDTSDTYFPYPLYAIELLDDRASGPVLKKDFIIRQEYSESTYASNLYSTLLAR